MVSNFIKHICRSSLTLCVLGSLLFFLVISSSSSCLGQDDFADTGMSYRIPGEAESYSHDPKPATGKRTYDDSFIYITLYSPGELVLTDPQGRRTGFDPLTNTTYDEIPDGGCMVFALEDAVSGDVASDPIRKIYIPQPITGEYTLKVTGTGKGNYDLKIDVGDAEANQSDSFFTDIPISSGSVHSYSFYYDKTIGSETLIFGAIDGVGQRPRDVNKFLSFSNPIKSRTTLPAGTSTFPLTILYGKSTIPSSFKAKLNGVDITYLFSPAVGSNEVVIIDLQAGRNVLLLSIDGEGHATDRERLVFL
ncbi:MAG: hypothetical protein ACYSTS_13835, partial [Planctomycetota bacterium]